MTLTSALVLLLGLVAVLVAAAGYFAVVLQGRLRATESRLEDEAMFLRGELRELHAKLRELAARPPAAAAAPAPASTPPVLGRSLNLTKRSQVLRLHQRGAQPAEIASTLELPVNEVELVVKLHQLLNITGEDAAAQRSAFAGL